MKVNSLVEVKIDYSKCTGDDICICTYPVPAFELHTFPEYSSKTKYVVINKDACFACRIYEDQCPNQAITIQNNYLLKKGGVKLASFTEV